MSGSRRRRIVTMLVAPAAVAGGLAGCGSPAGNTATASPAATTRALPGEFSAAKLRGALLTRVNGVAAKVPASSGSFSSLSRAAGGKLPSASARVTPEACAGAMPTELNMVTLSSSLAANVTFEVGRDRVWEVLVEVPDKSASSALAGQFAATCAHYTEVMSSKSVRYTVTESAVSGIGEQAAVLNVRRPGSAAENLWSLSYRGKGFAGSVSVAGPNASERAVEQLGRQAYALAAKSLG